MISFRPSRHIIREVVGAKSIDIESTAVERWQIAPKKKLYIQPAKFLSGQLDRIKATEFTSVDDVIRTFKGGYESIEDETLGFRLKNVDLVDGVLYSSSAIRHLRERQHRFPAYRVPTQVLSGALYETWIGNRWFGSWLMEDCITYQLAQRFGAPVTTARAATQGHVRHYEELLGINPIRITNAHFEELIIFRDESHNDDRKARADRFRNQLIVNASVQKHAGVFLLRGTHGMSRILRDEQAVAEKLAIKRGFKVLDPMICSVEEIVSACAGARVVAGVEGSHLVHGLMVMPTDACLLVIQPPFRVVSTLKMSTDHQGQDYAFVVASGTEDEFSVDFDEMERTLDLIIG